LQTVRFHVLISLMLSSQTKDEVTSQAVTNLHDRLPGGLTAGSLATAPSDLVAECIQKVGFWRRKTEYIQEAARAIIEGGLDDGQDLPEGWEGRDLTGVDPDGRPGDIPMTLGGLCKLKGVGPKMAFLALQCAWNINAGVGVDVHVHRITKYGIYALIYLVHTTDSLVFIL
jgi:endonuclease-3